LLRRFLSSPLGLRIASALIATYVRLAARTTRWRLVGDDRA
jgi:hypothetical protein